jgi:hypothetical protein
MDYRGMAAVIIAIGLGATLVGGIVAVGVAGRTFSEVGGQAMIAIGGALAGALAAYLVSRKE